MNLIPQHYTLQHKKSCGIRVGPDLFRLVSILGYANSLVGGGGGGSAVW